MISQEARDLVRRQREGHEPPGTAAHLASQLLPDDVSRI